MFIILSAAAFLQLGVQLGINAIADQLAEIVSGQFISQSPIGRIVYDPRYRKLHDEQLLDNYIQDFIYLAHPCSSRHEHKVIFTTHYNSHSHIFLIEEFMCLFKAMLQ